MLWKVYQSGVTDKAWLLIKNLHTCGTSQVAWKGKLGPPFPIRQGIRQGVKISPTM